MRGAARLRPQQRVEVAAGGGGGGGGGGRLPAAAGRRSVGLPPARGEEPKTVARPVAWPAAAKGDQGRGLCRQQRQGGLQRAERLRGCLRGKDTAG